MSGLALAARHFWRSQTRRAVQRIAYTLLVLATLIWTYADIRWGYQSNAMAFDFRGTPRDPATAIIHGHSPYPAPNESAVDVGNPAYYPPLLMLLVAPLTYLPWTIGAAIWTALLIAAVLGILYVLDVRDWRCYALALISAPVVTDLLWGNVTLLLAFVVALAWRWRRHPYRCAVLIGICIAAKFFLWPVALWLLGTRRYRSAAAAVAIASVGVLVPWAVIGFNGMRTYPELLRVAQEIYALHGFSVATMLGALGLGTDAAVWGGLVAGTVVAVAAFVAGSRGRDEESISLAIVAALLASPIVWEHYFAFLLIPLAIAKPRFSAAWMTLLLFRIALSLPAPRPTRPQSIQEA